MQIDVIKFIVLLIYLVFTGLQIIPFWADFHIANLISDKIETNPEFDPIDEVNVYSYSLTLDIRWYPLL